MNAFVHFELELELNCYKNNLTLKDIKENKNRKKNH